MAGSFDKGHHIWTEIVWPWQISSWILVTCSYQSLCLHTWTFNIYFLFRWDSQRMLGIHVCAADARHTRMCSKCCNAVFFSMSLGVWGVRRDTSSRKLLSYCPSVDALFAELVCSPSERSKVNILSLTIQSFMHLYGYEKHGTKVFLWILASVLAFLYLVLTKCV